MNDEIFLRKVGEKIKKLRKKAGYTSYETYANDFDLQRQTVYRAENGKNMNLATLNAILNTHGITPEEFFRGIK